MKRTKYTLLALLSLVIFSCHRANNIESESTPIPEPQAETQTEIQEEPQIEFPPQVEIEPEEKKEEPPAPQKEPEPQVAPPKKEEPVPPKKTEELKSESVPVKEEKKAEPPAPSPSDDEYTRSVGDVHVDKDTFEADKKEIMGIIEELAAIMGEKQYKKWIGYVDSDSVSYWSKSANLRKASSRLPVRGLQLKSLEDYFKYVFVPARQGRTITEIRYVSETYVKAVDVQGNTDLIYYYFKKINGKWKVYLPPLE